ncbi:MAG: FHA domain-containing protein [Isosphaeraceae bacterium]|nr:FHA domain-containing protein [Isosphaeraceae bacterium]
MRLDALAGNLRQAHEQGVAGAIGALIGLYSYAESITTTDLHTRDALAGAIIGGSIGLFVSAVGPLRDGARLALARAAVWGAITGAVGGAVGLLVGEWVLGTFQGGIIGRSLGWTVLGLGIGSSQWAARRSTSRLVFGLIGGGLGGFLGGFLFESLRQAMGNRLDLEQGLGILALGAGLGVCLALVEQVLRRAWVVVLSGRQEGRSYLLANTISRLGLDERAEVGIFGDAEVDRRHAEIVRTGGRYELRPLASGSRTRVNDVPVTVATPLADGDRIMLGGTRLLFRCKGGA